VQSAAIAALTALCTTCSRRAANVKLRSCATATKYSSCRNSTTAVCHRHHVKKAIPVPTRP